MEVGFLVPIVVGVQMPLSNFLICNLFGSALPEISPLTKVKVGLYEVNPLRLVFVIVHLRLIYLVWLKPEAAGGAEPKTAVDASRYPEPVVVPTKVTEAGV